MPVLEVSRQPREKLRELVEQILTNAVFISEQVPDDLLGSVFMPLLFGALSLPEGEGPTCPEKPQLEVLPPGPALILPDAPVRPQPPARPPYPMAEMALVDQGRLLERDVLPPYEAALAKYEVVFARWSSTVEVQYTAACAAHQAQCDALRAAHAEQVALQAEATREAEARFAEALEVYEAAMVRFKDENVKAHVEWTRDVGILYEEYAKALPRGVNGYPMFMSFRILHKDDWAIVKAAVFREQKRRQSEDLLGPE